MNKFSVRRSELIHYRILGRQIKRRLARFSVLVLDRICGGWKEAVRPLTEEEQTELELWERGEIKL